MSSFGGTVKLTGESEYQKALKNISGNLKLLSSEMKFATSIYDQNDKSVENLSSQNEILNKKIEEQQKKVDVLADALAKAKEETGENSATTNKWQIQLNEAQAELNKLNHDVEKNEKAMEEATDSTKEEAKAVEDFGEEAEKSGDKALSLGDIIKANLISDAIKGGLQALANGISAVGSAMSESLTAGAEYADNILTLSAQTGLSTDTLEKYGAVAELADVSMETFTGSLAKTTKAMGEAQKGSTKYVEAYDKLGVKVTDANGNLRDSEAVYWETVDALKGIENETERDALAMELFGKKAQDLNTIVEMGSEGFKDLEQSAVDMGAVLGGEGLEALGNLDDQMQIFKSTTASTGNILASAFAPMISGAMTEVNEFGGAINGLIASVLSGDDEGIEGAMIRVSEEVGDMVATIRDMVPQMMDVASNLISALVDTLIADLPWIVEQGMVLLSSLLEGIVGYIPKIIPVVMQVIGTLLNTILENLPMIINMGMQMLVSLVQGIADMLPELIPTMVDAVMLMVETLLDNIDLLIDVAIDLIMALADGLLEALPRLIDKIPVIIDKLIMAITDNLPKIIEMGIELTLKLAWGLIKAIPQLLSKIPEIISSLVKGFNNYYSKLGDVGLNLVKGIWNGIKDATSWILDKIKGFGKSVLNGIKSVFGIHSPSVLFRDEVGKNLALGVGEGFADTMADVSADMQSAIPTEFDANIGTNINMASGQSQMSTFDMMVLAFKQALTEVKVVMDDREMGTFVTDTVTKVVYA